MSLHEPPRDGTESDDASSARRHQADCALRRLASLETLRVDREEARVDMRVKFEAQSGEIRGAYDVTVEFTELLPIQIGCSGLRGEVPKYRVTKLSKSA